MFGARHCIPAGAGYYFRDTTFTGLGLDFHFVHHRAGSAMNLAQHFSATFSNFVAYWSIKLGHALLDAQPPLTLVAARGVLCVKKRVPVALEACLAKCGSENSCREAATADRSYLDFHILLTSYVAQIWISSPPRSDGRGAHPHLCGAGVFIGWVALSVRGICVTETYTDPPGQRKSPSNFQDCSPSRARAVGLGALPWHVVKSCPPCLDPWSKVARKGMCVSVTYTAPPPTRVSRPFYSGIYSI